MLRVPGRKDFHPQQPAAPVSSRATTRCPRGPARSSSHRIPIASLGEQKGLGLPPPFHPTLTTQTGIFTKPIIQPDGRPVS